MAATRKAPKVAQMSAEIPQDAADLARQSVDQAQAAFDRASDFAHGGVQMFDATAGALKANVAELQLKAMEIAQANTNAVFAHLHKLLAVSGPGEVFPLTQTFAAEQAKSFLQQVAEVNELTLKFATETAKPVQEGVLRSFDGVRKAFEA
ncbi:MAG: phasin family protein [Parvibaculaceae bacterium]